MTTSSNETCVLHGKPHRKQILLADVNFPSKFEIDRKNNKLFFCINADEFSDQSFQLVVLNLDTGLTSIIPGIRNGFASAVNQVTGKVYLGGSDGIFKYNYESNDIDHDSLVNGVDIFDMYFKDKLYYVDTRTQTLHYLDKCKRKGLVNNLRGHLIQKFIFDDNNDLYFVNSFGLFVLTKGNKSPTLLDGNITNLRGGATDVYGKPYFVAMDGIYEINKESEQLSKVLTLANGYGLAFNKDNNLVYSEERSVVTLLPY